MDNIWRKRTMGIHHLRAQLHLDEGCEPKSSYNYQYISGMELMAELKRELLTEIEFNIYLNIVFEILEKISLTCFI